MNLQFAILGLLTYFPLTGYNLGKIFKHTLGHIWDASLSQVYRELNALEEKGFVSSTIEVQDDRPDRRVYRLTDSGREAFEAWLNAAPEAFSAPRRDPFALRVFFSAKMEPGTLKQQLEQFLEERRAFGRAIFENKQRVTEIVATMKTPEEEDLGMRLMTRRAELSNQAMIQWAEECLRELEKSQP